MSGIRQDHAHMLASGAGLNAGLRLPAFGTVEVPRAQSSIRNLFDVLGGVIFALIVGVISMNVGTLIFAGSGWGVAIGWESVWLVAAIICMPLMPSGIQYDISLRSTLEGLKLDLPELIYATAILGMYVEYLGGFNLSAGPIAMALAVGSAEEFIFRVLLLGWLVTKLPAPQALVVSAVVFGAAHLQEVSILGLMSIVPQTAGGFVLGAVFLRTRNPIPIILAHAYWDWPYFMALGSSVSGGSTDAGMPTLIGTIPWIAFAIYGLWLVRYEVPMVGRLTAIDQAQIGAPDRLLKSRTR